MAGRQLCQWDKDSCADAGFLKIDLLGLGMLSCVEECVDRIARLHGAPIDLSRIPLDDPAVFAEIQAADTVGVFQIESRAQMQSLLRTRPRDDRRPHDPGGARPARSNPGEGGPPVHRAPRGASARTRPSSSESRTTMSLRKPLAATLGVVVFQDQVLDVAIALAGFTIGEAEDAPPGDEPQAEPRRARGAPRALRRGAVANGRPAVVAEGCSTRSSASRGSGFRRRTQPRSGCSPTSRPGCATTIRPSSSAGC